MDVWISFKGIQNIDDETNSFEFNTKGTMDKTAEGYKITYDESETIGIDGVFTTIHLSGGSELLADLGQAQRAGNRTGNNKGPVSLLLERKGSINAMLVLEKGRRTICNYDVGHGSLVMGVYATEIINGIGEFGGELSFKYTLDVESRVTSSHDVCIKIEVDNRLQ